MKDIKADADKFDAVLRRMTEMKPLTAKELSAKLKAEKAAKSVQKMDKPKRGKNRTPSQRLRERV